MIWKHRLVCLAAVVAPNVQECPKPTLLCGCVGLRPREVTQFRQSSETVS